MIRDLSNAEQDTANTERNTGYPMSRRDIALQNGYDEADDATPVRGEDCRCGTCLECLLMWATVWREKNAANDREYWAGDVA